MTTFEQGLQVTGIGMLLVFVSLLIVAGLIWALNKLFPGRAAAAPVSHPAVAAPVRVVQAVSPQASLADEAAAIAVALVRQGLGRVSGVAEATRGQRVFVAMPWERPAELWGEDLLQGETTTVLSIDPGTGNWKSQGRLSSME